MRGMDILEVRRQGREGRNGGEQESERASGERLWNVGDSAIEGRVEGVVSNLVDTGQNLYHSHQRNTELSLFHSSTTRSQRTMCV